MIIERYKCNNCKEVHERKFYENESEAVADIFTESYFVPLWDKMKGKMEEKNIEEFCKKLVFAAVYHYHKNRRRIKIAQGSIRAEDRAENKSD